MKVKPLTGHIGAEIKDINLSGINAAAFDVVKEALWTHQVLVFRRQEMTIEDHIAIGEMFGELHTHPAFPGVGGHPEVLPISNNGKEKTITEVWHSDVSCDEEPPLGSILYLHTVPDSGGDTVFASMYAAYDALSESMRASRPLRARQSPGRSEGLKRRPKVSLA